MSATDYLSAINFGTSTGGSAGAAETTSTLGTARLDTREPPTQYHLSNLQITRLAEFCMEVSAYMKGGTRVRVLKQITNPFGATESGFYVSSAGTAYLVVDGVATSIGSSAASVQVGAATFNGANSLDGDYPYADVTWVTPYASAAAYRIAIAGIVNDGGGMISVNLKSKTASGVRVYVSAQFTGVVELHAAAV